MKVSVFCTCRFGSALSPAETGAFCLELAKIAKKNGTLVSFDLNHRASFWKDREKELREIFVEIAKQTDILIGNEEDFQLCLGVEGPPAGGKDVDSQIAHFKEMTYRTKKTFPDTSLFATTLRKVESATPPVGSHNDGWR